MTDYHVLYNGQSSTFTHKPATALSEVTWRFLKTGFQVQLCVPTWQELTPPNPQNNLVYWSTGLLVYWSIPSVLQVMIMLKGLNQDDWTFYMLLKTFLLQRLRFLS